MNAVDGLAIYLRSRYPGPIGTAQVPVVERAAVAFAQRCKAMKLGWVAIAGPWQDSATSTRWLNSPAACGLFRKALRAEGIPGWIWGYPALGGEVDFIQRMSDCAGDDGLLLLDPELGMNPTKSPDMTRPNASAKTIVSGLRAHGAKKIGLSTYGGVPSWFPLRAFLGAGIDFCGGQTYTDDDVIAASLAEFAAEIAGHAPTMKPQLVPNYGLYAKNPDGTTRSKTAAELVAHLDAFGPQSAMVGWAENFLNAELEQVLTNRGGC